MNRLKVPIIALGAFALLLALACGPAAAPAAPGTQAEPTPTLEPEATPDPAQAEPTAHPTPDLTPRTKTPVPNPPDPLPTHTATPGVRPTSTPLPVHPQGLEGCKNLVLFGDDDLEGSSEVVDWCMGQLTISVGACLQESSPEAQRRCGENIADEYRSYYLRYSSPRCAAIEDSEAQRECRMDSNDDFDKALGDMYGAWEKVRIGAEGDPAVAEAWKDTTTCLEEHGFKNIDRDLLFAWQRLSPPADWEAYERGLSPEKKDLRFRMDQPARDCAKEHGLFDAQDIAWAEELRRLGKTEPELVGGLINEGLLEALDKPGTARFLGGNVLESDTNSR